MIESAAGKGTATPCKRHTTAYCIRVLDPVTESIFNWCADTLEHCKLHVKVAERDPHFKEVIIGCTLRK